MAAAQEAQRRERQKARASAKREQRLAEERQRHACASGSDDDALGEMDPNYVDWLNTPASPEADKLRQRPRSKSRGRVPEARESPPVGGGGAGGGGGGRRGRGKSAGRSAKEGGGKGSGKDLVGGVVRGSGQGGGAGEEGDAVVGLSSTAGGSPKKDKKEKAKGPSLATRRGGAAGGHAGAAAAAAEREADGEAAARVLAARQAAGAAARRKEEARTRTLSFMYAAALASFLLLTGWMLYASLVDPVPLKGSVPTAERASVPGGGGGGGALRGREALRRAPQPLAPPAGVAETARVMINSADSGVQIPLILYHSIDDADGIESDVDRCVMHCFCGKEPALYAC